ncbi:hypothetical protein JCM10207_007190 [Rhodosporidiobolus poonsookiae]
MDKENMAFALTDSSNAHPPAASKPAARGRKPAAATTTAKGKSGAGKTARGAGARGKKAPADEAEDDDDELMAAPEDSGADSDAQDELDEVVAETQFNEGAPKGKGRKAPAKKAAAGNKAPVRAKEDQADDLEMDEVDEVRRSAKEKKLQAQLDAAKKALAEQQTAFKKLSELRNTRAEEAELRLREIADERQQAAVNTIQTYKTEADVLRSEVASLTEAAYASPRSKAARAESHRVRELEGENAALLARVEESERLRQEEGEAARREAEERERRWERALEREVRETEERVGREAKELREELATARTELTAEISHSKSLQAKLKSAPASLSGTSSSASLPAVSSSAPAATLKLQEEVERLTAHLQLNEDLTGFAVHSVKTEDMGPAYTCVLSDAAGQTGGLNFKLTFHADSTVSYQPDVVAERDAVLVARLPQGMAGYMRFEAERSAEWFKHLFNAVNKVK